MCHSTTALYTAFATPDGEVEASYEAQLLPMATGNGWYSAIVALGVVYHQAEKLSSDSSVRPKWHREDYRFALQFGSAWS